MKKKPYLDFIFEVKNGDGNILPVDHGFKLFSALSGITPIIHGNKDIGILPITGFRDNKRNLYLNNKSKFTIRAPSDKYGDLLEIANTDLNLCDCMISFKAPYTRILRPHHSLRSRIVTIKGFTEPHSFLDKVKKQLEQYSIEGVPTLVERNSRSTHHLTPNVLNNDLQVTVRVHDAVVIGFHVRVSGLSQNDSIKLQEIGIGGRRRFGCGVFLPDIQST